MSKLTNQQLANFGKRLAAMRKAAGYTQQQLAEEIGVTRRMIAYYEAESEHPPTASVLVDLANALGTSVDALLGIKAPAGPQLGRRLQRRLQQIETLGPKPRKQIMQLLDTFLEAEQLKQQAKNNQPRP